MCYRIQFGDTETDAVTSDSLRGIEARQKQRNERGLERESANLIEQSHA